MPTVAVRCEAKATALLLADLGVTKSHSRPHTSNDNPFSESHFKTMKYQPQFPQRFGSIQDAKTLLPQLLRLVQPGPPSRRHRSDDARPGALRSGRRHPCRSPKHPRSPPSTKTPNASSERNPTACKADCDLDQSTADKANLPSLNSNLDCLRIVDTFRRAAIAMAVQRSHRSRVTGDLCRDAAHAGGAEGTDQQD